MSTRCHDEALMSSCLLAPLEPGNESLVCLRASQSDVHSLIDSGAFWDGPCQDQTITLNSPESVWSELGWELDRRKRRSLQCPPLRAHARMEVEARRTLTIALAAN